MAITGGIVFLIISFFSAVKARIPGNYAGGPWQSAHATFYGGSDASGTMGTLCFGILNNCFAYVGYDC